MGPHLDQSILGVHSPVSAVAYVEFEEFDPSDMTSPVELLYKMTTILRATECLLSPCVRTYNVSVTEGIASIQTSLPDFGKVFNPEDYLGRDSIIKNHVPEGIEKATACWTPEQGGSVDVMLTVETWPNAPNLWNTNTKFAGCPVTDYLEYCDLVGSFIAQYVYNVSKQTWQRTFQSAPEGDTRSEGMTRVIDRIRRFGFDYIMENVAASMTQYAQNLSDEVAYVTVYESQAYVSVDWAYLVFPAVLVLLGIAFLALAIVASSRNVLGLWKCSLLPMIYPGLTEEMDVDEFARVSSMERKAQEVTVKIEVLENGMRKLMV